MSPIIDPTAPVAATRDAADENKEPRRAEQKVAEGADPEAVRAAVEANRNIVFGSRSVEFSVDQDTNRVVVTIRSGEGDDGEVVRQIPPEDYLKFVSRFNELLGVIFDEVA